MRALPVKRAFPGGPSTAGLLAAIVVSIAPCSSRANNGIPGSLGVLLPLDKPQEIGLATTFGLILSDDGGTSWVWTCEQAATSMANVYTVGAPPADRFYALSLLTGLSFSDDESCGWRSAGGALAGQTVSDFFTDPSDPLRVLAAATPATDGGGAALAAVYGSNDGGATFGAKALYVAPAGAAIVGIEIAKSDPQVIYLTYVTVTSTGYDPVLVRSADGLHTWTTIDLLPTLGSTIVRILAVDSANSDLVYLRASATTSETLAVTRDGGMTFATPLTVANGALECVRAARQRHGPGGRADESAGRRGRHHGRRLSLDRRGDDLFILDARPPAAPGRSGGASGRREVDALPFGQELQRRLGAGHLHG